SQTLQFLSKSSPAAAERTVTGLPQVAPPFVDRFTITAAPVMLALSARDETIQTPCIRSWATEGSLTRANGPGGFWKTVIPGSVPLVYDTPLSTDLANTMPEAPPSVKRPDCAAATPVEPKKYESGSTTVLCWLEALVKGSVAILRTGIVAPAARLSTSATVTANPRARAARLPCIAPPFQ